MADPPATPPAAATPSPGASGGPSSLSGLLHAFVQGARSLNQTAAAPPATTPTAAAASSAAKSPKAVELDEAGDAALQQAVQTVQHEEDIKLQQEQQQQEQKQKQQQQEVVLQKQRQSSLSALAPKDVRWYFSDPGLFLGLDTKPQSTWLPFCSHDSNRLEAALTAHHAASKPAASVSATADVVDDGEDDDDVFAPARVPVRGGLFDVDVAKREAYAVFWDAEPLKVMRATWFIATNDGIGEPLDEKLTSVIESIHLGLSWQMQLGTLSLRDLNASLGEDDDADQSPQLPRKPPPQTAPPETALPDFPLPGGGTLSAASTEAAPTADALGTASGQPEQKPPPPPATSATNGSAAAGDPTILHQTVLDSGQMVVWLSPTEVRLVSRPLRTLPMRAMVSLASAVYRGYTTAKSAVRNSKAPAPTSSKPSTSAATHGSTATPPPTTGNRSSRGSVFFAASTAESAAAAAATAAANGNTTTVQNASVNVAAAVSQTQTQAVPLEADAAAKTQPTPASPAPSSSEASDTSEDNPEQAYCSCAPATKLIFIVHGIGQMSESTMIANGYHIRNMVGKLAREGALGPRFQKRQERIEVLPVEWRTTLTLDHGTIAETTPGGVEWLRNLLNTTALDILYFTSPRYSQEIMDSVTDKLNTMYKEFIKRQPKFTELGGIVSIYGHSLGGVISYELLLNQDRAVELTDADAEERADMARLRTLEAEMTTLHSRRKRRELARERLQMASKGLLQPGSPNARRKSTVSLSLTMAEVDEMVAAAEAEQPMSAGLEPRPGGLDLLLNQLHTLTIVFTKLAFPVPYLFAAGSPIATFLTMRGASAQPTDPCHGPHLLPPNTRVFNIFHSVDPLAYRLEPLIFSSERQPAVPVGPWPPKAPSLLSTTLALESVSKAADSLLSKLTSSLRSSNSSKPDDATVVEVVGSKDNGNGSAVALASSVAASASATPSPPPLDSSAASDGLFSRLKSSLRTSAPKSENVGPATKVAATATAAVAATAMPGAEAAENVEPTNKDEFEAMVPPGRLDFVLDESVAKSAQPMQYMRLTTSHTHYFYRFDILYFITQVLIHHTPGAEMPAEPETTAPPKEAPSKDVDGTIDPV